MSVGGQSVTDRLLSLGVELPDAPVALGAYVPATRAGQLIYSAGQLPLRDGQLLATGLVFDAADQQVADGWIVDKGAVDLELARACARQCVVNALAAVSTVAELDRVEQVIKVDGFVAAVEGFRSHPKVIDAASELLVEVFGEAGRHARAAVGVPHLPMGSPVELEIIVQLSEDQ